MDGAGVWLRRVKSSLGSSSTLIVRHLEVLDRRTSLALTSLLEENDSPGEARGASDRPRHNGRSRSPTPGRPPTPTAWLCIESPCRRSGSPRGHSRSREADRRPTRPAEAHRVQRRVAGADAIAVAGNVRQLAAVVRSAIAGRSCGTIGLADLPIDVIEGKASTFTTFEKAEYQAIVQALRFADGNKKVAAAELGIARSTLYRKLRSYRIDLDRATF